MNVDLARLKHLLSEKKPEFWSQMNLATRQSKDASDLMALSVLRKRALKSGLTQPEMRTLRLALLGANSFHPLRDIAEQIFSVFGWELEIYEGAFDNFESEISDPRSPLKAFKPEVVFLIPSEKRCRYTGSLSDPVASQRQQVDLVVGQLLKFCEKGHEEMTCDLILSNFVPAAEFDPGSLRSRSLASPWAFRRMVNLELGLRAPSYVTICDLDFLSCRRGLLQSRDPRSWFESKQPGSIDFVVDIAWELVHCVRGLRESPKKVLVLDLDNTLWGGVVGELGVEGIEIGETSARGEAFRAFQTYILSLASRGILLAVCSKNDSQMAALPFEKHPEMVLKLDHLSAFKANWEPKSENIKAIAEELGLGLDSFVFVDDSPAEIEIVRQFSPSVETILLGPDPADYISQVDCARFFEPKAITSEDRQRVAQYQAETKRQVLAGKVTDMDVFLQSLEMKGTICEFTELDLPRVAQLINKSNQFNLTTRRRSESDLRNLVRDPFCVAFSFRLEDKFGDYGLISVFIGKVSDKNLTIDTWLMSCRVLKRQVEMEVLNEVVRLARERHCVKLEACYIPTAKNKMVSGLLPELGFEEIARKADRVDYSLSIDKQASAPTRIQIVRRAYENGSESLKSKAA